MVEEQKFIKFYADLLIVQEEAKFMGLDSLSAQARIDSLYQSHQITQDQIKTTLDEYKKDLKTWRAFYDKVIWRLEEIQKEESRKKI